jgi:hypothetical protein
MSRETGPTLSGFVARWFQGFPPHPLSDLLVGGLAPIRNSAEAKCPAEMSILLWPLFFGSGLPGGSFYATFHLPVGFVIGALPFTLALLVTELPGIALAGCRPWEVCKIFGHI